MNMKSFFVCVFMVVVYHAVYGSWNYAQIDTDVRNGADSSIIVDKNNVAKVAYFDFTYKSLKFAEHKNNDWKISTIDDNGYVGLRPSLINDNLNASHVFYWDPINNNLKHASYNQNNWNIENVTNSNTGGDFASAESDTNGDIHVLFQTGSSSSEAYLKYAHLINNSWEISNIDTNGYYGKLDINNNNILNVCYSEKNRDTKNIRYGSLINNTWVTDYIFTSSTSIEPSSLSFKMDKNNTPHISFIEYGYGETKYLKYLTLINNVWKCELIDGTLGSSSLFTSLDVDSNNKPHISYYFPTSTYSAKLKYAYKTEDGWNKEYIDTIAIGAEINSIVLDSHDNIYISYDKGTCLGIASKTVPEGNYTYLSSLIGLLTIFYRKRR